MTQIAQGAHVYLFPEPGQVYRVQADDVATVQVICGAPSAVVTLTAQAQTFGPYDAPAKLKVSANTAAAEYTLLRAHYAELTAEQVANGAVGVLGSNNAGVAIEPDGDVPSLGGGAANLASVPSPTGVTITSDTGTDATITGADATNAGVMMPAHVTKLDSIATGATANASDADLRDRATHTGEQAIGTVTGLAAALAGKVDAALLGAASGIAELDSTGKLKASQIPASALVDVSATGMTLAAGILTMTQDDGGPDVVVDLNSFATDGELTAGLAAKAWATQGAKADTALQPGVLPAGTTLPAEQISDSGAAGRDILRMSTLDEIKASVSGDTVAAASRTLTAGDFGDTLHATGATTYTVPAGLGTKFTCAIYGTATVAAGVGVTIVDARAAATVAAICVITPTPTANSYVLIGGVL